MGRATLVVLLAALTGCRGQPAVAQEPSLDGVWVFAQGPAFPGPRMMQIRTHDGVASGSLTTDWYGPLPMNKLVIEGDTAHFEIDNGNAKLPPRPWTATLSGAAVKVVGDIWDQHVEITGMAGDATDAARLAFPPPALPRTQTLAPDGLAATPPMGWSSWNTFADRIDDATIRGIADALVSSGLRDAGYRYVNIDDGWQGERDANGVLQPNARFPDMKALADYVHGKGLKLGIYSSPGPKTCAGYAGSYGHAERDAKTWGEWGIDYLKYDLCSGEGIFRTPEQIRLAYQQMGQALRATGRPIIYSLCQYGRDQVGRWGREVGGHLWRTTGDIEDKYEVMAKIGLDRNGDPANAGPGGWNDPDMLEVGNGGMNENEYRTHLTLWAISAAPLLLGNDVRKVRQDTLKLLLNPAVIALDQDALGRQGASVRKVDGVEIWRKALADGAVALALFNRSAVARGVAYSMGDAHLPPGPVHIKDLWTGKAVSVANTQVQIPAHGVVLLKVSPDNRLPSASRAGHG